MLDDVILTAVVVVFLFKKLLYRHRRSKIALNVLAPTTVEAGWPAIRVYHVPGIAEQQNVA